MRTTAPDSPVRSTMSSNSEALVSRPLALIVYWNCWSPGTGGAPICPAETSRFCSRMAAMKSPGVIPRLASREGSSQIRMA